VVEEYIYTQATMVLPIGRDRLNKSNNFAGEASHDYRYPDY
jgi:hypothetical protein